VTRKIALIGTLVAGWVLAPHAPEAQDITLGDVLDRAARYVAEFGRDVSGVVAEEHYVQNQRNTFSGSVTSGSLNVPVTDRELRSDVLLVRPPGSEHYIEFRDVFEVDGKAVRDREERLSKLFLESSATGIEQMNRIVAESARYNIGSVVRTINISTLPLIFLEPDVQSRVQFRRVSPEGAASSLGIEKTRFSPDIWVIEYQEQKRNTVIRRPGGLGDLPARGRFWIEPATGRVWMTELRVEEPILQTIIDVVYDDQGERVLLPSVRGERYWNQRDRTVLDGRATYSRFRRFSVQTEQQIARPDTPRHFF
jgi:hypothetical protein